MNLLQPDVHPGHFGANGNLSGKGCKIPIVGTGPNLELVPKLEERERNWKPLAIAAGAVLLVAGVATFVLEHGHKPASAAPVSAPLAAYAPSLAISNLAMSEAAIMTGGKETYVDGRIANTGSQTVTSVTAQVLFRNPAHEVAQNVTQPMQLIRAREPYIDTELISADPIKPGETRDFRLAFDGISPDWDGAYPEIRILGVETR